MKLPIEIQKELVTLDVQLKTLIRDIPDSVSIEEIGARNREASEIIQKLNSNIQDVENLALAASKTTKVELNILVDTYRKLQRENQSALRQANVQAQKSVNNLQRNDLLQTSNPVSGDGLRNRGNMQKEMLLKNSTNVTSNLQSISRTLNDQIQLSSATLSHLGESSTLLTHSGEEAKSMDNEIQQSSKLLTKYDRRESTDKLLIFISFLFFFACVFYVVKRRIGLPFSWLWSWLY